jgi:hypothetical protein
LFVCCCCYFLRCCNFHEERLPLQILTRREWGWWLRRQQHEDSAWWSRKLNIKVFVTHTCAFVVSVCKTGTGNNSFLAYACSVYLLRQQSFQIWGEFASFFFDFCEKKGETLSL